MIAVVWKALKFQLAVAFVVLFLFLMLLLGTNVHQNPFTLGELMVAFLLASFLGWYLVRMHLVEDQFIDFLSPSLASVIITQDLVILVLVGFYFSSLKILAWLLPSHDVFRILGFTPLETSVVVASIFLAGGGGTFCRNLKNMTSRGYVVIAGFIGAITLWRFGWAVFWVSVSLLTYTFTFLNLNRVGQFLPGGFAKKYLTVLAALSFAVLGGGIWMTWSLRDTNPFAAARFLPGAGYIDDLGSSNLEVAKVIYQIKVLSRTEAGPDRDRLVLQSIDSLLKLCPYEPRFSPAEVHCSDEIASVEIPSLSYNGISQALVAENPYQVFLALKILSKQKEVSTDHLQSIRKIAESDSPFFADAGVLLESFPNSIPGVVPIGESQVTFYIVSK